MYFNCPDDWDINVRSDGIIEARNKVTGQYFKGSEEKFKEFACSSCDNDQGFRCIKEE